MLKRFDLPAVFFALCVMVGGQTPSPAPNPVYKTYTEAMAAGKAAAEKPALPAADAAYAQAEGLATNDDQRFEAMIKRGGVLEKSSRPEVAGGTKYASRTKIVMQFQEAAAVYSKAAELKGISVEKKAEATMLIADIYGNSYKSGHLPSRPLVGNSWNEAARAEYTKVVDLPGISANTKARALHARAKTYSTDRIFGRFDNQQVQASAKDLEAAIMTDGATDKVKADALKDLAELAKRINDASTYVGAYDKITKLPAAEPAQKIDAYDTLARLFIDNSKVADARKAAADGLAVPKARAIDRSVLYCDLALVHLIDPANKTADGQKALKLADAELDKAVKSRELTPADKIKLLIGFGEYFQLANAPGRTDLAVLQYQKVLALKGITPKDIAMAQYGIGEAYRIAGKKAEAKAAYEKVSKENGQYHGYAQHRIKELDMPK